MSSTNTQFSVAVHILMSLAKVGAQSSTMLAYSVNTNPIFLKRILAKLSKAGLIETAQGRGGGSELSRSPRKITLFDIYTAVDSAPAFSIQNYPKIRACDISSNIQEMMGSVLEEVQSAIASTLRARTLADLMKDMNIPF